jgi:hypothetical protein
VGQVSAAWHDVAEEILEHFREAAGEVAERIAGARARRPHAALERGMAEAVIGGPLLVVLQDVIGLVDFLEAHFGGVIAGIAVGMEFHRQLAIGGLQCRPVTAPGDLKGLVITTLGVH